MGTVSPPQRKSFALSQSLLRDDEPISSPEFSAEEGPSFCSRPTPVTPVPENLRAFDGEGAPPDQSGIVPRSTRGVESMPPSSDRLEQGFFQSAPQLSLPPSLPPPVPRRPASRARQVLSLMLFVTLFGGVGALLGLALLQKLALTPGEIAGTVRAFVGNVL